MSVIEFNAEVISASTDDLACIVALADDPNEPANWLILQRALCVDEQDKKVGLDTYNFELSGSGTIYGGIERASLLPDSLSVDLQQGSRASASKVLIHIKEDEATLKNLAEKLRFIFSNTNTAVSIEDE